MNANLEFFIKQQGGTLEKATPEQLRVAEDKMRRVADLGGFGAIGIGEGNIHPAYAGGLDVSGVLDERNTALSSEAKEELASIMGVDRKEADKVAQGKGSSSADKMKKAE